METLLIWPASSGDPDASSRESRSVADRLTDSCAQLFSIAPTVTTFAEAGCLIALVEVATRGWDSPSIQRRDGRWALALDHPVDAAETLADVGHGGQAAACLVALTEQLQQHPMAVLERLSPPFVLAWNDPELRRVHVQNDGLGFGQLFLYRRGDAWAITNRLFALTALGVTLRPVANEWANRAVLG